VRPLSFVNLMYEIQNLAKHLAEINTKRAEAGDAPIKLTKWADAIKGAKQVWFAACLPKPKTGVIEGLPDKDKALDLLAAVNKSLKIYGLGTIPATAIVEVKK
jgi:hypothetical protein